MAEEAAFRSVVELAAMSEGERIEYFLAHPMADQDPSLDPLFVARARARLVPVIQQRDAEQATRRRARRAS